MKQIFRESKKIGSFEHAYMHEYRVHRTEATTRAIVTAYYDKRTKVLVVDRLHKSTFHGDIPLNEVAADRIYETHPTRESGLRSVIAHADAWYSSIVVSEGDSHLTDQEVRKLFEEAAKC